MFELAGIKKIEKFLNDKGINDYETEIPSKEEQSEMEELHAEISFYSSELTTNVNVRGLAISSIEFGHEIKIHLTNFNDEFEEIEIKSLEMLIEFLDEVIELHFRLKNFDQKIETILFKK